jgi:hypothetical protein
MGFEEIELVRYSMCVFAYWSDIRVVYSITFLKLWTMQVIDSCLSLSRESFPSNCVITK